ACGAEGFHAAGSCGCHVADPGGTRACPVHGRARAPREPAACSILDLDDHFGDRPRARVAVRRPPPELTGDGLTHVAQRLVARAALRDATVQRRYLGDEDAVLILFDQHAELHVRTFSARSRFSERPSAETPRPASARRWGSHRGTARRNPRPQYSR